MTVQIFIILAVVIFAASFVSFLIGRDIGETRGYDSIREANERLLKQNHDLKWESNRLNRAMAYYDDGVLKSILKDMDEGKMSGYGDYEPK